MSAVDLESFAKRVTRLDDDARERARRRLADLYTPADALGRLAEQAVWLAGAQGVCPTRPIADARVVVVAADHGIAELGVSAYGEASTAGLLRAVAAGGAAVAVLARAAGVSVHVHDLGVDDDLDDLPPALARYKVRRGGGRTDREDAASAAETAAAFRAGVDIADAHVDAGGDLFVLAGLGVGATTPAAAIVAAVTGGDATAMLGRTTGLPDAVWMRKAAAIRDTLRRARRVVGDPLALLAATGGVGFAAMTGFLLEAAVRRTPVVLDGLPALACALVAQQLVFRSADWWLVAGAAGGPACTKAVTRLVAEPVTDQQVTVGDGSAGVLALTVLRAAAAVLPEVSTRAQARRDARAPGNNAPDDGGDTPQPDGAPEAGGGTGGHDDAERAHATDSDAQARDNATDSDARARTDATEGDAQARARAGADGVIPPQAAGEQAAADGPADTGAG